MELKEYIAGELRDLRTGLKERYLKGLTPQELMWKPAYGCHSIALILFHMSRFEDAFCQGLIFGIPELWQTEEWFIKLNMEENGTWDSFSGDKGGSFIVSDTVALIAYFDRVRDNSLDCLDSLSVSELDRKVPHPPGEVPVAKIFSFIVGHMAQHMGAITYIRGLQRGMKIAHV